MSETKNLKLFKHDDPPNNTNAFDVKKALNDNLDKIDDFAENIKTEINSLVERKIVKITEDILAETEYELPINYVVGNRNLKIFWENVLLEEGEEGNYIEVGEPGQTSNKVKFGLDLEPGETLIIEKRGVLDEESA